MNYGQLKTAIADWLMREDLTAVIPTFIRLAQARASRELRVRQMLVRATTTVEPTAEGSSFVVLPIDWLEAKNIQFNTGAAGVRPLTYVSLQEADKIRATGATGNTTYYTLHANQIELLPPLQEAKEVELTYYATLPPLEDDTDDNWMLAQWPDIYLYGSLLQSAPYLHDDERAGLWAGMYDRLVEEARLQDARAETSGSTPRMRFRAIG